MDEIEEDLVWEMEDAIQVVEEFTGGHWDRRRHFRVETTTLQGCVGEWVEDERVVRIHSDLLADPERLAELRTTLLHEAIHMVHPGSDEVWTERIARDLLWELGQRGAVPDSCHTCFISNHDLCFRAQDDRYACECPVCWPEQPGGAQW
jgi:hypothetical protein